MSPWSKTVDALATGAGTYAHIEHLDPLPFGGRPVFVFTRRCRPRPGHLLAAVTSSRAGALERWNSLGLDPALTGSPSTGAPSSANSSPTHWSMTWSWPRSRFSLAAAYRCSTPSSSDGAVARGCHQLAQRRGQLLLPSAERATVSDLQCPATMLIAAGGEAQCAAGCVRSQDDWALTQQGRAQVRHLVAQVAHRRVAAVYSSAMRRAAESAELAASALGLPVVVLDGLQELSAGDREPVSCDDRGARHVSHAMVQAGLDIGWPPAQDGRSSSNGPARRSARSPTPTGARPCSCSPTAR